MKKRKTVLIIVAALLAAAIAAGTVAAVASDDAPAATSTGSDHGEDENSDATGEDEAEGPDRPITGPDLEKASAKALEYLGEGRVTDTEIEDEESYYEVEVTLPDGRQVDVQLDEAFNVVGTD